MGVRRTSLHGAGGDRRPVIEEGDLADGLSGVDALIEPVIDT
jgi:hypothetical protein